MVCLLGVGVLGYFYGVWVFYCGSVEILIDGFYRYGILWIVRKIDEGWCLMEYYFLCCSIFVFIWSGFLG